MAKPVKAKLLEKMLVRWALEGKKKLAKMSVSGTVEDRQSTSTPAKESLSTDPQAVNDQPQIFQLPVEDETAARSPPALTAELDRLHFHSNAALAKSSETNGDRALRRIQAEELSQTLRDDKLLSWTDSPRDHHHSHYQEKGGPTHALTQENMEKLAHEQDPVHPRKAREHEKDTSSSVAIEPHSRRSESRARDTPSLRPSLSEARLRESERTVTAQSMRTDG